jgi:DNA-binding transcriptional regulator YhcF (GntR family)
MYQVKVLNNSTVSKVQQIVNAVVHDIEAGVLRPQERLPSINEFSEQNSVARDTVEKAYIQLRKRGFIESFRGRGYFIMGETRKQKKVLLIFNKMSSFKKIIYESLLKSLGTKAKVDLQIHHYSPRQLKTILEENIGKYDCYVIMPHFFLKADEKEYTELIRMVPAHQLVLFDKNLPQLLYPHKAVYQDFKEDIYQALSSSVSLIKKYKQATLVFPEDIHHPKEIIEGIKAFCSEQKLAFNIKDRVRDEPLRKQTFYITTDDDNLAKLLQNVRKADLGLGSDIGIISFNETAFKELLDITVITTDFAEMGRTAAKLILGKECKQYKNPFTVIHRGSL